MNPAVDCTRTLGSGGGGAAPATTPAGGGGGGGAPGPGLGLERISPVRRSRQVTSTARAVSASRTSLSCVRLSRYLLSEMIVPVSSVSAWHGSDTTLYGVLASISRITARVSWNSRSLRNVLFLKIGTWTV